MNRLTLCVTAGLLLTTAQAFADPSNVPPPTGAIFDLGGVETATPAQSLNHDGSAPVTESAGFVAGTANTDITFALREDPSFLYLSNISLIDNTIASANLLLNGDFTGGTTTSNGNTSAALHWTFDNVYGASASGVVSTSCGSVFTACWYDGSVQAYDAIDQVVSTIVGHHYTLSFAYWDDGELTTASDLSTNGDITGTGGNGADILAYALTGLPPACTAGPLCTTHVPEPLTLSLFGAGLVGAAALRRRRKTDKAA